MLAVHDPGKVALLLEHGADVTVSSTWGFSALLLASAYSGAGESLRLLLEQGASPDCRAANGATPLFAASTLGDTDRMAVLLEAGAAFNVVSLEGALQYAACCGDVRVVELLLELGGAIDAVGRHGRHPRTALMSAVISGYTQLARFLVEKGADLEICDDEGLTALAWAAKVDPGHSAMVELLVRSGAKLESRSDNGRTPLQWALHFGNEAHARILRDAGARRDADARER